MSNFQNKSKPPYVGCKSNTIYPTGQKPPIPTFRRKITEIVYTCSITKRKFKNNVLKALLYFRYFILFIVISYFVKSGKFNLKYFLIS